jgi:cytoskeletal protein CcmA (bactofilin family)
MFSRTRDKSKKKDPSAETFAADLSQQPVQPAPPRRTSSRPAAPAILSSDMTVIGTIACSGDMHVDGRIEGEIFSTCLTIGEKAVINGDVRADEAVIRGHVRGNITARQVKLASTCHVEGDITHNNGLSVETGAFLQGNIRNCEHQIDPAMGEAEPVMEVSQYYRDQQRTAKLSQQRAAQAQAPQVSQAAPAPRARSTFANAQPQQAPAPQTQAYQTPQQHPAIAQPQQQQVQGQARAQAQTQPSARPDPTDKLTEALQKLNAQGPSARPRQAAPAPQPVQATRGQPSPVQPRMAPPPSTGIKR